MPSQEPKLNSKISAKKAFSPYLTWYLSSLSAVVILACALSYLAGTMYLYSEKLVNSSNKKIIETAGIEITVELKKKDMDIAKQIISRKLVPFELPPRQRNIFLFNSYVGEEPNLEINSASSTINPPL